MLEYSVYGHYDIEGNLRYIGSGKGNRPWVFYQRSKIWHDFFAEHNPIVQVFKCNISKEEAKKLERELINEINDSGYELLNICSEKKGWLDNEASKKTVKDRSGKNHPLYGTKRRKETIEKILATKTENDSFAKYWLGKKRDPELMAKLTKAGHCEEARRKRSETMTGRTLSEEQRKKISEAHKGRKLSDEQKAKISKAKKGKDNGLKGRVMPKDHRDKISASHKGKKMPREAVEKQRAAITGRPSPKRKPVRCIDNGIIYSHAKEAAEKLNCNIKHVQAVCLGRRQSTGGHKFEYA